MDDIVRQVAVGFAARPAEAPPTGGGGFAQEEGGSGGGGGLVVGRRGRQEVGVSVGVGGVAVALPRRPGAPVVRICCSIHDSSDVLMADFISVCSAY
ncbi:hypothetical protein EYF80_033147 [Liparis tanakae]|uniref:Uncharacterized protein n=1 Tax=Liparis tanakae TaxID=230148 RepID=A0A4Z2GTR7_9TELE|nr:hypothetical protein EYF80_033147 [Liparis tanakae]